MNLKMLSDILKTIVETLSILVCESGDPLLCKSMHRQGSIGIRFSFKSTSLAECLLMFIMIDMILF